METNIEEIWKDAVGFNGKYKVSNLGNVLSYCKNTPKLLKLHMQHKDWYYRASLSGKLYSIHRLVAMAFIPNPENKPFVNHINGIKWDNRVENLQWTTRCENMQHAYDTGLLVRVGRKGANSNFTKITCDVVFKIREMWESPNRPSQRTIAKMFNICQPNVSFIVNRRNWAHI